MRVLPCPKAEVETLLSLFDEEILQDEIVHFAFGERTERVSRSVDDRLSPEIEGSVENDGDACCLPEALDQAVVTRAVIAKHGLEPSGAIHVSDGRKSTALALLHWHDIKHVPSGMVWLGV